MNEEIDEVNEEPTINEADISDITLQNDEEISDIEDIQTEESSGDEINDVLQPDESQENTQETENEEILEETGEDLDELKNLDENKLAEVLGEDIENSPEDIADEVEEINIDDKIPEVKKARETEEIVTHPEEFETPDIREKTLGSVLNINWEELKKAKAKVTITIDFGD